MQGFSRRTLIKGAGAGLAAASLLDMATAWAQTSQWKPEAGATLNLLRWKRFLQGEEDAFLKIVEYPKADLHGEALNLCARPPITPKSVPPALAATLPESSTRQISRPSVSRDRLWPSFSV